MPIFTDHFGIILLILSPLYRLFPSPTTLLMIQAFFVSLSSIFIYKISIDRLKSIGLSCLITLAFLTSEGILDAINFDFHLATISVLPLSFILYTWYFQKWRLFILSLFLSLTFKEDVTVFIFGLGLYMVFFQKYRKMAIFTILFAIISFYLIKFKIMAYFWPSAKESYISTLTLPLDSPFDIFILLVTNPKIFLDQLFNSPIKIQTIDTLYGQFAFLPFLSPFSWLTVFPNLFLRFSSVLPHFWSTQFHYNANLLPFLAVSTILVIDKLKFPVKPIAFLLIFLIFFRGLNPYSMIWSTLQLDFNNNSRFFYIHQSLQKIPPSASVSAQSPLLPHLANRERIYLYPEIYGAEYIVLNQSLSSYPLTGSALQEHIKKLKDSKSWKLVEESQSLVIFKQESFDQFH